MGTAADPQITVWDSNNNKIDSDQTVSGYGILIITGRVRIEGNFEFHGLVVQKTKLELEIGDHDGDKDQVIHGAILAVDNTAALGCCGIDEDLIEDTKVDIQGDAQVLYNCEALNTYSKPVTSSSGSGTGTGPVSLLSWRPL